MTFSEWLEATQPIQFVSRPGKVLVPVSVAKLDQQWKKDFKGFYIPPGAAQTDARCQRVVRYLQTGRPLDAPELLVGGDRQTFHDGRHRFAVLRDMGLTQISVAVRPKHAEQVRLAFS